VVFEFIDARHYFIVDKLAGRVGNHPVFFGEVFRCEDFCRCAFLNQKRATFDYLLLFDYG
jgi:hypothetical protein